MAKRKFSRVLSIFLLVFIMIEGLFFVYLVPKIRLSQITIEGDLSLTNEELFILLNWKSTPLYFNIHPQEIALVLQQATGEDVEVSKEWPNHLIIKNFAHGPVFVTKINENMLYFNEYGNVVPTVDATTTLPTVVLLPDVNEQSLREKMLPEWIKTLGQLKRQYPEFYSNIEKIQQEPDSVYMKFRDMPFILRVNADFSIRKIHHTYWQTKQIFESRFPFAKILDMRGSEIVYKSGGGVI
ncbi:MAG: cell division protein FtsQ/DivIB [Spirochaetia bacterium]